MNINHLVKMLEAATIELYRNINMSQDVKQRIINYYEKIRRKLIKKEKDTGNNKSMSMDFTEIYIFCSFV